MPTKKEEAAHDCKKDCELLHKEIAALKKEVQALKAELKKAPKGGGGADPRVEKLVQLIKLQQVDGLAKSKRLENGQKSLEIIKSL
jgi:uncharacterized small protein (DUF1192 family)